MPGIHWVVVGSERFWFDVSDDTFLSAIEETSGDCCGGIGQAGPAGSLQHGQRWDQCAA